MDRGRLSGHNSHPGKAVKRLQFSSPHFWIECSYIVTTFLVERIEGWAHVRPRGTCMLKQDHPVASHDKCASLLCLPPPAEHSGSVLRVDEWSIRQLVRTTQAAQLQAPSFPGYEAGKGIPFSVHIPFSVIFLTGTTATVFTVTIVLTCMHWS